MVSLSDCSGRWWSRQAVTPYKTAYTPSVTHMPASQIQNRTLEREMERSDAAASGTAVSRGGELETGAALAKVEAGVRSAVLVGMTYSAFFVHGGGYWRVLRLEVRKDVRTD